MTLKRPCLRVTSKFRRPADRKVNVNCFHNKRLLINKGISEMLIYIDVNYWRSIYLPLETLLSTAKW